MCYICFYCNKSYWILAIFLSSIFNIVRIPLLSRFFIWSGLFCYYQQKSVLKDQMPLA